MSDAALFDRLAETLAEIRPRAGDPPFGDRRRVIGLLADKVPEAKREIRAVGTAIDEGVPTALAGVERHLVGMEMDRQTGRLEDSTGLRSDIGRRVVQAFAFALDLGPLPSIYQNAQPAPEPDWIGASVPVAEPSVPMPSEPAAGPGAALRIGRFSLDRKLVAGGAAGIALLFTVAQLAIRGSGDPAGGNETQGPAIESGGSDKTGEGPPQPPPVTPHRRTADQTGQAAPAQGYAGELADHGVPAKAELEANVGSPTPLTIPGAERITTAELRQLIERESSLVLVDVLANYHPVTLHNAVYAPEGGMPGTFEDRFQSAFARTLRTLTGDRRDVPLVFFCAGWACWESYNAALRARAANHRRIYWYRGGLASWSQAGLPMGPLPQPHSSANFLKSGM